MNFYATPYLKNLSIKSEKVSVLKSMHKRAGKFSCISTIALSAALLLLYKKTKDKGLLCPLSLTLLKLPLTKLVCCKNEECTEENVDECAESYGKWNWAKIGIDALAFTAVICTVLYKK